MADRKSRLAALKQKRDGAKRKRGGEEEDNEAYVIRHSQNEYASPPESLTRPQHLPPTSAHSSAPPHVHPPRASFSPHVHHPDPSRRSRSATTSRATTTSRTSSSSPPSPSLSPRTRTRRRRKRPPSSKPQRCVEMRDAAPHICASPPSPPCLSPASVPCCPKKVVFVCDRGSMRLWVRRGLERRGKLHTVAADVGVFCVDIVHSPVTSATPMLSCRRGDNLRDSGQTECISTRISSMDHSIRSITLAHLLTRSLVTGHSCRLASWPLVTRAGSLADDVPYPCWPRVHFVCPNSPITHSSNN